jgi:hypothetical protein
MNKDEQTKKKRNLPVLFHLVWVLAEPAQTRSSGPRRACQIAKRIDGREYVRGAYGWRDCRGSVDEQRRLLLRWRARISSSVSFSMFFLVVKETLGCVSLYPTCSE